MLDPQELFIVDDTVVVPPGLTLVHALDGFIDAGGARRLAREQLLSEDSVPLAVFDVDQLFDYRARRPVMLFVRDHWESYDEPRLVLHLAHDSDGAPFLVLAGPEPDVQWERFVAAVALLVARFEVALTVGLNAIPMAVPHTRPAGITAHASDPGLISGYEPWVDTVQVPASAGHLLEYRLGTAGIPSAGLAVHVPQYVAQALYPLASAELVDALGRLTSLSLSSVELRESAALVRAQIDEQVREADEVAAVVRALEEQYDAFVAGRETSLLAQDTEMPTADELGAELERFLAENHPRGEA